MTVRTQITTTSPEGTADLGRRFAATLTAGDVVLVSGRLGAGKTVFVAGVAEGLGVSEPVTSPSFVLARSYRDGFLPLVHADVYRLRTVAEFEDLDLVAEAEDGVLIVEWGEAVEGAVPHDHLVVRFTTTEADTRRIEFEPHGSWETRDLGMLS